MKKILLLSFLFFSFVFHSTGAVILPETDGDTGGGGSGGTGGSTDTYTNTNTNGSGTGIAEEGSLILTMMVYPNPSSGDLYITPSISSHLSDLKLFNSQGAMVYESNDKIQRIDLRPYPAGIYYLQVTTNRSEKFLNKVIKTTSE